LCSLTLILLAGCGQPGRDLKTPQRVERSKFVDSKGFVLIDGRPRLILGMYGSQTDQQLQQLSANGYNLVAQFWPPTAESLDRVWRHGLYGTVHLYYDPRVKDPAESSPPPQQWPGLAEMVSTFKDHPGFLGWELYDEITAQSVWYDTGWKQKDELAQLEQLIEAQKAADPDLAADRLERLRKSKSLMSRGLPADGEAMLDQLWAELGQQAPNPRLRGSYSWARADRMAEGLGLLSKYLREQDGKHLIWTNHAALNSIARLAKLDQYVDAAGCDHYPVDGVGTPSTGQNLYEIGWFTDRMRAAAPGKSCWMVLQGFGWRDFVEEKWHTNPDETLGRRPNLRETRFMAYDAIVHGANGIIYYGSDFLEGGVHRGGYFRGAPLGNREVPQLWKDIMTVGRELRALEPAIVAAAPPARPKAQSEETMGPVDGQGPALMLRHVGQDWVLIAVNETNWTKAFSVSDLPAELEGRVLHRLYSDDTVTVRGGRLRDGIVSWGVNVYATSRRFESPSP
jgi:hypothetical protein